MIKIRYKKIIIFVVFIILFYVTNSATALEIEYPTLSTGVSITSNTPLPEYLKYVFDFGIFIGFFTVFLTLVFAGVLYLLSPAVPSAREIAKDRVSGSISGLLILATLYLIATTINPQLKFFKLDELDAIPPSPGPMQQAGVHFYNESDCNPPPEKPHPSHISSVPHLQELANRTNAVDIVHGADQYIAILYESPNFFGKCQYINPNKRCVKVEPFAVSASVYKYNHSPGGNGVIFYRKSFYDRPGGLYRQGGWYKVESSEIETVKSKELYVARLSDLKFKDVPYLEQDCVKWKEGKINDICLEREPPNLSRDNISSIEIKGNYVVLLVYFDNDKPDPKYGPWSFCQIFSTDDDINKDGPKQIKWEHIRNMTTGKYPNFVVIIGVKQK